MSETPEFDNWKEIEHLLDTNGGSNNREIAIVKALQNITIGVVNSRHVTSALRDTLAVVGQRIEELNTNIKTYSDSSENLTKAIKNATWAAAIIAGLGVIVAALSLCWEIYKTLCLRV